jgi:putative transposase
MWITVGQCEVLARQAGASRFAFNPCLRTVKTALTHRKTDPNIQVPWRGFDLVNAFNSWKKTEHAGRVFAVDATGDAEIAVGVAA